MNATEIVTLGRTGLPVTRLGLGTAPLGGLYTPVSEESARQVVQSAWDRGLRFFDTAPLYGYGSAEQRLGRVLSEKPRSDFVLSTKVGRLLRPGGEPDESQFDNGEPIFKETPPVSPVFDFSYDGVMRSLEQSFERLQISRVDIAYIHDPDHHFEQALAGAYRALDKLRSEGVIRAVGAGMNQADMLARFARQGDFDCFLLAGRYTLLDQSALSELLPLCADRGISIVAGGVYNSGILADPSEGARYNYMRADPGVLSRAQRMSQLCARHGVPLKAAAIQFPAAHPAVVSVLMGCRSVEEVEENLHLFEEPIPSGLWDDFRSEGLLGDDVPTP